MPDIDVVRAFQLPVVAEFSDDEGSDEYHEGNCHRHADDFNEGIELVPVEEAEK